VVSLDCAFGLDKPAVKNQWATVKSTVNRIIPETVESDWRG
jgi:hypothetical protein